MLSSTPGSSLARDPATCGPNIRWREAENWGGNTRILPRPCLGTDCGSSVRLSRAIDEMCAYDSSGLAHISRIVANGQRVLKIYVYLHAVPNASDFSPMTK